jgi:hypothetical protein
MTLCASAVPIPSGGLPVRQRTTAGSNGAKRSIAAHSSTMRSSWSSGPGNGTGKTESVDGMHVVAFRPLAFSAASTPASSRSSGSLNSQMPTPSTPAFA